MVRLEHALDSWKSVRDDTIQAVQDFPANEFDFRATPDMQTFGEIARHILGAGEALTRLLLDGEGDFTAPDIRTKFKARMLTLPPEAGPAELAAALRESIERLTAKLAAQDATFYAGLITRMDGQRVTRLEMMQYVKEHELTHRSQLFMYLRLKGVVPATTRRRLAKAAAK